MTEKERKVAAKQFAADWAGRGDEKQDSQRFWLSFLQTVCGIENPGSYIEFEKRVKVDNFDGTSTQKYIDGYLTQTRALIEQKGRKIDLRKGELQSDGALLTPFQQARRYGGALPQQEQPRWIVVCNFQSFEIHDMNRPNDEPEIVRLADLEKEYFRLDFLVDTKSEHIKKEMEISLQAGELVGVLYDALLKQYMDPDDPETLKSLNALCVRLVFCLYAEDAGIFGSHTMFHDYLQAHAADPRRALIDLFHILDQRPEERDPYLDEDLLAFPYVNGGLFADESLTIPRLTPEIVELILKRASEDFDWSEISPTIFGAVFESTLNPETRRSGGMHYTSIENIHKVIDPLFLDELKTELAKILAEPVKRTRENKLTAYQKKLSNLTFLDPACGSGNFLTETYLSMRRLENQVLSSLHSDQIVFDVNDPIQVSISQFYGIEINDFAVTVAKTALWIAESQMMKETEAVVHMALDFLPLKTNAHIVKGNALRLDWETVVPKTILNYIMGNPPFVGYSLQSAQQKEDILSVYVDEKGKPYKTAGKIDYVAGWYYKAASWIQNTHIRAAFVSTNSITQGEQVASVWKPLYDRFHIHIDFAHRTFRWDSEANMKAHVHCVIVGFSTVPNSAPKRIFAGESYQEAENINAYLLGGPDVFIESRSEPICIVRKMTTGNRPADGGHLIIEESDYQTFIQKEPSAIPYIKKLLGSEEFINNKNRWCLWLVGVNPSEIRKMPEVMKRIELCKEARLASPDQGRQKLANTPALFRETQNPLSYILIPKVSSERRRYVPMGFFDGNTISTDLNFIIPEADIFCFGVLTSNVHMAWMRAVCGRLKSDYRYSKDIVYNNFPWPTPTPEQRAKIEKTAQGILDAREQFPDGSLADLYDETVMPSELRTAHQQNDRAVMEAYGFNVKTMTEPDCVAELMKLYQELSQS